MDRVGFKPVKHKEDKVIIIAGGESLRGVDLSAVYNSNIPIITVNNVIFHLKRANYWMTVDPMFNGEPQKALQQMKEEVYYYCAFPDLTNSPSGVMSYQTVEGVHYLERIGKYELPTLQEDKSRITSLDSVYGALGLAYHMEAKEILILGLDAYGELHWYDNSKYNAYHMSKDWFDGYKQNLVNGYPHCLEQFDKLGTKIINGSKNSLITAFRRESPEVAISEFLC
jgi:hypothetical protein